MIADPNDWELTAHALHTYEGLAEKYLREVESLKKGIRAHLSPGFYELGDYNVLIEDDGTVVVSEKGK